MFQVNQTGGMRFSSARRLSEAGRQASQPRGAHRRHGARDRTRRRPRRRRPRAPGPQGAQTIRAGEVILCGRHHRLAAAAAAVRHRRPRGPHAVGVPVRHALPGVGRNLQDHPFVTVIWEVTDQDTLYAAERPKAMAEWLLRRTGPLSSTVAEVGAFHRTRPGPARRRHPVPHGRRLLRRPRRRDLRRTRDGHRAGADRTEGPRPALAALGRSDRQAPDHHQLALRTRGRRLAARRHAPQPAHRRAGPARRDHQRGAQARCGGRGRRRAARATCGSA